MLDLLIQLGEILLYTVFAVLIIFVLHKSSKLLFDIQLIEEVKAGNRAAAIFSLAIFIFTALLLGLLHV